MREHDRNNGLNPKKRGQMNRQKNRELTGLEENWCVFSIWPSDFGYDGHKGYKNAHFFGIS